MQLQRTFRKIEIFGSGFYGRTQRSVECDEADANVITSKLKVPGNMHAPALDLDFPARLVPSKTEGHFHLYLEIPMPWKRYRRLMKALKRAGIIEDGYYQASKAQGESTLRIPPLDGGPQRVAMMQRAQKAEERVRELTEEVENLQDLVAALRRGGRDG